jgi:ABC-type antimicrobial peptide transport system permease subunit
MALANTIRHIVSATPRVDLVHVQTLEDQLSSNIAPHRFEAILFVTFAAIGLLLAIAGVYGVLAYSVAQRTQEIGIRMALGAHRRDVLEMVLARSLSLICIGLLAGLAASLALTRFMGSLLYGVKPTDAWTLVAVSILLGAVASLAAYIPARRASKVDPMVALRYE